MPNNMRTEADEKKDKIIKNIIVSVIVIIVLAIIGSIILYITTDMYKSEKTLFFKYVGKNFEKLDIIDNILNSKDISDISKGEIKTEYGINFIKNVDNSSESANSTINKLKLTIEEQKVVEEQYDYKNIKLTSANEQLAQIEYLQDGENVGIKALGIVQYLYKENSSLKELAKQFQIDEEQMKKVSDIVNVNTELSEIVKFSEEEREILKQRYFKIIDSSFSKGSFLKKGNQKISVNGKEIIANAYLLNTTKENMNYMYINMLKALKQDEIILSRIEKLQEIIKKTGLKSEKNENLKEKFEKEINEIISNISRNNIGSDKISIVVYEKNGKTVRTQIPGNDREIIIDSVQSEQEELLKVTSKREETTIKQLILNKSGINTKIYIENNETLKPFRLTVQKERKISDNQNVDTTITYEVEKSKIEVNINKKATAMEVLGSRQGLNRDNSIQVDNLEEEKLAQLKQVIQDESKKEIALLKEKINEQDANDLFNVIGLKQTIEMLEEGTQISEAEKNRFNYKFEFLQGKELMGERMLQEIDVFKDNILDFHVISNDVLKIEMNRTRKGDERIVLLQDFIRKDMKRKFDVTLEYDETTGLVKYIVMTIVRKKK